MRQKIKRGEHIVSEGHGDGHFIYLIVTTALKECRGIPILEMRILRFRKVKMTFSQVQEQPNDPLNWNPDPKLFLPHQTTLLENGAHAILHHT